MLWQVAGRCGNLREAIGIIWMLWQLSECCRKLLDVSETGGSWGKLFIWCELGILESREVRARLFGVG